MRATMRTLLRKLSGVAARIRLYLRRFNEPSRGPLQTTREGLRVTESAPRSVNAPIHEAFSDAGSGILEFPGIAGEMSADVEVERNSIPAAVAKQADESLEVDGVSDACADPSPPESGTEPESRDLEEAVGLSEDGTELTDLGASPVESPCANGGSDDARANQERTTEVAPNSEHAAKVEYADDRMLQGVSAGECHGGIESADSSSVGDGAIAEIVDAAMHENTERVTPERRLEVDRQSERRRRILAAPSVEESSAPIVTSAPPIDERRYILWNRAITQHCLLDEPGDDDLFLTITPTILAAALGRVEGVRRPPEEAEANFVDAIAEVYRTRVLAHPRKLGLLRRCSADELPDCIAFLACCVLAAYHMRSDEESAANAYYRRLAEILKCDLVGGHPRGFDPEEFASLWHFLSAWLRTEKGRRLAMPGPDAGLRRFVALPLTHVPLRRVDIERLPELFVWAGYEPGARIARAKLDQDLVSWSLGRTPLTSAGMAALHDERRAAVLAQIAHESESWDGAHTDSFGRRSARVEILLDIVQRRPELFYLPRRPAAFPQMFDDGVRTFEASEEGWYDPVPLGIDDGPSLSDGFEWQLAGERLRLVLHRPGASAIALPASTEYTGYLSHSALQLGAPAAALCLDTLAQHAAEYLSEIAQQRCVPISLPGLPAGWRLFTGLKPQRRGARPPVGLEALGVESATHLIPMGGLRLGGRWAWVVGAPPRLMVAGLEVDQTVTIDGEPITVAEDGTLGADGALARPGVHIVEAAGLRRRLEIVEPQLPAGPQMHSPSRIVRALPRGSWTLIGAVPGEVGVPMYRSPTGSVASCPFPAVWAIEAGSGPGARVLCLSLDPPPPKPVARFAVNVPDGGGLAWASAIYNAAIRRPRMALIDGQPCERNVSTVWAAYARAARQIKREFRKARR